MQKFWQTCAPVTWVVCIDGYRQSSTKIMTATSFIFTWLVCEMLSLNNFWVMLSPSVLKKKADKINLIAKWFLLWYCLTLAYFYKQ